MLLILVLSPSLQQDTAKRMFSAVSAGGFHTCALAKSGVAYCWGLNLWGQVGSGTVDSAADSLPLFGPEAYGTPGQASVTSPVRVATELLFASISAGDRHTCALTRNGRAHCWGHNEFGQLGDGTTGHRARPVAVHGGVTFTRISAGGTHTCGVTPDGTLYCWGGNWHGQLGVGREAEHIPFVLSPIRVAAGTRFRDVAAGGIHTCALDVDGRAYCWGDRRDGVLGIGGEQPVDVFTPRPVAVGDRYRSLATGPGLTCGITMRGRLNCWGRYWTNSGDIIVPVPQEVGPSRGIRIRQVSVGVGKLCIVSEQGDVVDPGLSNEATCSGAPVGSGEIDAVTVGGNAFGEHTCALMAGGSVQCWGDNSRGQLGGLGPC